MHWYCHLSGVYVMHWYCRLSGVYVMHWYCRLSGVYVMHWYCYLIVALVVCMLSIGIVTLVLCMWCRYSGAEDGRRSWQQQVQASGLCAPQSPGLREEVCLIEDVDEGEQN